MMQVCYSCCSRHNTCIDVVGALCQCDAVQRVVGISGLLACGILDRDEVIVLIVLVTDDASVGIGDAGYVACLVIGVAYGIAFAVIGACEPAHTVVGVEGVTGLVAGGMYICIVSFPAKICLDDMNICDCGCERWG